MLSHVALQNRSVRDEMSDWIADDFQAEFWVAKLAIVEATNTALGRHGVHAGQQFVLASLWHEDGLTPAELARRVGTSPPTITRMVARMEGSGLLERRSDSGDRRLVRVFLTSRGRELEGVLNKELSELSKVALDGLSPTERSDLVRNMRTVRENLERNRGGKR